MRRSSSLVLALFVTAPAAAEAYCQQTTTSFDTCMEGAGEPIAWKRHCMSYSLHEAGSSGLPFEEVRAVVRRSMDTWENATRPGDGAPCTDFFFEETSTATCTQVEYRSECGNVNLLVWREEGWVDVHGHDRGAIALSTIYYTGESAHIVSTDMEFNGQFYRFATRDSYEGCEGEPDGCPVDLQNTVTHEAGHLVGLAHATDLEATMHFAEVPGDTDKRVLAPDDVDGICDIYPTGEGEGTCDPTPPGGLDLACRDCGGGCCTVAPGPAVGRVPAVLLLLALLRPWRCARARARRRSRWTSGLGKAPASRLSRLPSAGTTLDGSARIRFREIPRT